jgi:hypothetical protein
MRGSVCIDPRFLDLGTSWRWAVSFTLLPFYPPGKEPPVPIGYEAGWAPRAGLDDMEKWQFVTLSRDSKSDLSVVQSVVRRYTHNYTAPLHVAVIPPFIRTYQWYKQLNIVNEGKKESRGNN